MRKQLVTITWALLATLTASSAQTPEAATTNRAALERVAVARSNGGIAIEFTARGAVTPQVETLASPARIVVDLPQTVMATSRSRIQIGSAGVSDVRIGTDASKTTRLVVDLDKLCPFALVPGVGGQFTLKLSSGTNLVSRAAVAPKAKPAPASLSASSPAAEPAVARTFTFVEPSFTKKHVTDPSTRAQLAASRFVERPEGNLLPASSAAQDPSAQTSTSALSQVQSSVAPAQSGPAPAADSTSAPASAQSSSTPAPADNSSATAPAAPMPAPAVVDSTSAPATVTPVPATTDSTSAPATVTPAPAVTDSSSAPTPSSTPAPAESSSTPAPADSSSAPAMNPASVMSPASVTTAPATPASSSPDASAPVATPAVTVTPVASPAATPAVTPAETPAVTPAAAQAPATAQAPAQSAPSTPAIQPAVNLAAEQKAHPQSTNTNPKYTGEPISVNLKDVDLKDFFRLIHEISGLNVVLDPDVHGSLTIVLDDVPWDQALDIVLKNNNLSRQLDGNVLRIASIETLRHEAESRRAQQEAEAMAVDRVTVTRFLSYAHSKDVVPTIKKFLSQRGDIVADDRTNAVIISDIPSTIPAVDKLIQQLDRKTQEVEIEARVISATRSFARDIGTQIGFGWGNNPTGVGGATAAGTSPIGVGNTPNPLYPVVSGGSTGVQIPLFSNLGVTGPSSGLSFVNATNSVRIDAILTMAESRGLLKVLSRPRVVTQNNIQAIVKQGFRLPIESAATLGAPATITYIDAVLKLTVTPQITVENTIFLNVDVENTTPDFGNVLNGNPALITQQATTQVLVTDGGTVVIGGVIQTNNSVNIEQVPLLGSIPWLGNLFKHQKVSSSDQELIFFITPRVIET
jgi:type IV pilus assembly protein PilQ